MPATEFLLRAAVSTLSLPPATGSDSTTSKIQKTTLREQFRDYRLPSEA